MSNKIKHRIYNLTVSSPNCFLICCRFDEFLVWDPASYGGISTIRLTEADIWAPKIAIYLSQSEDSILWESLINHNVESTGLVTFTSVGYISTFCELEMTYFPFDYQKCFYSLQILDAFTDEVSIQTHMASAATASEGREWIIRRMEAIVVEYGYIKKVSLFSAVIILERRSTFNSLNVVAPAIIISILCMLTFVVPVESGERLSYTLTTLLALSVYITYIGGIIPRSSNPVPILFEYIVAMFIISAISSLLTLIIVKVRWSKVRQSADNQNYIRLLHMRIYLSKNWWLKKSGLFRCLQENRKSRVGDLPKNDLIRGESVLYEHSIINNNSCNDNNNAPHKNSTSISSDTILKDKAAIFNIMEGDILLKTHNINNHNTRLTRLEKSAGANRTDACRVNVRMKDKDSDSGYPSDSSDPEKKADFQLLKFCDFLDSVSLFTIVLGFIIITIYTSMRFLLQEEPTIT